MKIKTITISIALLVLACSITAIAAEDVSVSGHTFEVPKDYNVLNTTAEQVFLQKDDSHVITTLFSDKVANSKDTISSLESKGYKFLSEDTYDAEGFKINQQNFEKDGLTIYSYNFKVSDGNYCIITFTMPSSETALEGDANPVTGILKTLE